jgi:arylsulfatase A-like enzyme
MDDGYVDGTGSDASGHRCNGPLRGFKGSPYEGGSRVPLVARWPGKTPAGAVSHELTCSVDLFATFAAMLGKELPKNAAEDSFNVLPALLAEKPAKACREHLVMQGNPIAIRRGDWKFIPGGQGPKGRPRMAELFNLRDDLGESKNVAVSNPEKVKELAALLHEVRSNGRSRPE